MKAYRYKELVKYISTADRQDLETLRHEFNQAVEFGDIDSLMFKKLCIKLRKRRDILTKKRQQREQVFK